MSIPTVNVEEEQLLKLLGELQTVPPALLQQHVVDYFKKPAIVELCTLEDFTIYYLAALRQNTELHFRSFEAETPQNLTPVHQKKSSDAEHSASTPIQQQQTPEIVAWSPNESQRTNLSGSLSSAWSSTHQTNLSTPVRIMVKHQPGQRSSGQFPTSTPHSNNSSGLCLGDFMAASPSQRSRKKVTPKQQVTTPKEGRATTPTIQIKKRVLPMTISKDISRSEVLLGTGTSSFSNENNLLKFSQSSELMDRSQSAALEMEARKTLLLNKQEIKNEASIISAATDRQTGEQVADESAEALLAAALENIDLSDITDARRLELLAAIYVQIIDMNLVPNVLAELSFTLQLLNVRDTNVSGLSLEPDSPFSILWPYKNSIYFAVQVLNNQLAILLQLDLKSLAVLLQIERLVLLPANINEQLELAYQRKQQEVTQSCSTLADSTQNVYFQHDTDSREKFPSQLEFLAFKTQRDLFYRSFKHWELQHLSRVFNFSTDVAPKIRDIFRQSEHVGNMAHLAKLFVSQLLISASEATESPEELGLKLDQLRLKRLAERLVTSNSSVEDQFPRAQAYFRDFINECGSMAFVVQLKLALYAQLLRYNDSTFELIHLVHDNNFYVTHEEYTPQQASAGPYIVRAPVLASMLTLAKFLGYVTAQPYNRNNSAPALVNNCSDLQQIQMRSNFQPDFDLCALLERAMHEGKLLITLPWLVQYLYMLDLVTLQLPNTKATLELLYALYAGITNSQHQKLQPSIILIIRACIGWLLEAQPPLMTNYYSYRAQMNKPVALVQECLDSLCVAIESPKRQRGGPANISVENAPLSTSLLEDLLPVACPFLSAFRVTISQSKPTHRAKRNRRYRYITTRLEQLNSVKTQTANSAGENKSQSNSAMLSAEEQQQQKLVDAFLHSQNASMRRLLEFVTERSFKCVVKDAQQKILLPSKMSADAQVNAITSTNQKEVFQSVKHIYSQACVKACQEWQEQVPGMLEQRIQLSLQSLLPANTSDVLQQTYAKLVHNQAQAQVQQWLQSSVLQTNFYCSDLQEVASKVCRANSNNAGALSHVSSSTELHLNQDSDLSLSDLLHDFQKWLHCVNLQPKYMGSYAELLEFMERVQKSVMQVQLPTAFYYLIGSGLVRLMQLIICRQPGLFTPELVTHVCAVWQAPLVVQLVYQSKRSSNDDSTTESKHTPGIFDTLLYISFVRDLSNKSASTTGFADLQKLLRSMLISGVLHIDFLTELFMPLFKENWAPETWSALSQMLQRLAECGNEMKTMKGISSTALPATSPEDEAKSLLFMEVLADLSNDLNF